MPELKKSDILRVAELARLGIAEADIAALLKEFNEIVHYVERLSELATEGIEATSQVTPLDTALGTPLAPDEPAPSFPTEEVVRNAPDRQASFFKIPRLIGGD